MRNRIYLYRQLEATADLKMSNADIPQFDAGEAVPSVLQALGARLRDAIQSGAQARRILDSKAAD